VLAALTVAISRAGMIEAQQRIREIAYGVAGAGILLAVFFSLWIAARVSRPIEQLARAAEEVAGGHWDVTVPECGRGEVSVLARSFNHMTSELVSQRERLVRLIKTLQPDFTVPPNAKFVIEDERQFPGFNPVYLFREGLAVITPLLWLLFALNLMGFYFLLSWTPTLLVAAKLPMSTAGLAISSLQVGGTVGALLLARWFERQQFLAIALVFLISVPVVAAIGYAGASSVSALMIVTFFAGFCVLGVQTGINVVGALVYPTSLRANGSGWELGIGRIGSIVGPLVGALFIGMPVQHLYVWSSLPFLAGAVVCFIIHRLNQARLRERPYLQQQQPAAAE